MILAKARAAEAGMEFCHPYDDRAIVASRATIGRELVADVADLRRVIVPLGGGGLSTGLAMAVKNYDSSIQVIGVQVHRLRPLRQPGDPHRAGADAGRRHRREAAGRDHPPAGGTLAR